MVPEINVTDGPDGPGAAQSCRSMPFDPPTSVPEPGLSDEALAKSETRNTHSVACNVYTVAYGEARHQEPPPAPGSRL
jgi:hypothetical protein